MSGIYGLFNKNGAPVIAQDLAPMAESMAVWGPDGQGTWLGSAVGLGHCMLHTTPESLAEKLPAAHPQLRDLVITADAWLDNRAELFAQLGVDRHAQADMADSTLILLAYERWGSACVEKLLGDFAFAIWDGRKRQLFCARDIFGNRPLLYYQNGEQFIFASDIKGLLASPVVPRQLDEAFLAAFLQQRVFKAQLRQGFWQDVRKLPPAHTLTVDATSSRLSAYWSPENAPEIKLASNEAYAEALRNLIQQAVASRVRTPLGVGSHLSGGLDSSVVAIQAARCLRQTGKVLSTFSWSPPPQAGESTQGDERAVIESIRAEEGLACHYLKGDVDAALAVFQRDITTEPTNMIWREQPVQRLAQGQGLRVMLSGWGGDEVISMHAEHYLAELVAQGAWRQIGAELAQRFPARGGWLSPLRQAKGWATHLYKFGLLPHLPQPLWLQLTGNDPVRGYRHTCIEPAFAQRHQEAVDALRDTFGRDQIQLNATQRARLNMGHLTRRLEDWSTEGASQQLFYRYPLLDRRVVEFGLGVPGAQYNQNGRVRSLMRRAGEGVYPATMPWTPLKREPAASGVMTETLQLSLRRWLDQVLSQPFPPNVSQYVQIARLQDAQKNISKISLKDYVGIQNSLSCFSMQHLVY